jgi:hypothetical protein
VQDVIYLGPVPANEKRAEIGEPDYDARSKAECLQHILALKRVCGDPPDGAHFEIFEFRVGDAIDRQVCLKFDNQNKLAVDYAFKVEDRRPDSWAESGLEAPPLKKRGRA